MNQVKTGKFLVSLRKANNWTQKDVAKRIGVTEQAVSKWERGLGFPDISLWNSICEAYNISLIEFLNGETNSNKKDEDLDIDDVLKETLSRSDKKFQQFQMKITILLIVVALALYIISLAINILALNYILFIAASLIVVYFLGIIFRRQSYGIKFVIISIILTGIMLGYSYLESVSIIYNYRQPIFSIKEIYKEYNVTILNSIFYDAYTCKYGNKNIHLLEDEEINTICPNSEGHSSPSNDLIKLKSGAMISEEQKYALEMHRGELIKQGYVDYNYMRQEDLNEFFTYLDDNIYCNDYKDESIVVKRKGGVCQYDNDDYYYCATTNSDGSVDYKKAENRQCK